MKDGNITKLVRRRGLFQLQMDKWGKWSGFRTCMAFQLVVHMAVSIRSLFPCKITNESYQENLRRLLDTVALGYSYPLDLWASNFLTLVEMLSGILLSPSTVCTDLDHSRVQAGLNCAVPGYIVPRTEIFTEIYSLI